MKTGNLKPSFAKKAEFGKAMEGSINDYFTKNKIVKTGDWRIWHKAVILFCSLALIYCVLVFGHAPPAVKLILCSLMGIVTAAIGFNVMHDANHDSFSSKEGVNYIMGLSLNFVGGNAFFWKKKHNVLHHVYTNINGHDEDIEAPGLRFHPNQTWKPIHRFQYLYWPFIYCLIYFGWVFINDFKKYFRQKILDHSFKIPAKEHFIFWLSKIWYFWVFVYIPIVFVGLSGFLIGYAVMSATCGLFIAVIFQLAHTVRETEHPDNDDVIKKEFVYHQVSTTADFATSNYFINWLCGGLNFQVEHHLVHRVSHIHYPAINKIVKKVCKDFGVEYHENHNFFDAIRSHVFYLKYLGKKPK